MNPNMDSIGTLQKSRFWRVKGLRVALSWLDDVPECFG